MRRRPAAEPAPAPSPDPATHQDWTEVARALNRLADGVEAIKPAAETIHGLGGRLDALCRWLRGRWPWIAMMGILLLNRAINAAPDEFPRLIHALADVLHNLA